LTALDEEKEGLDDVIALEDLDRTVEDLEEENAGLEEENARLEHLVRSVL